MVAQVDINRDDRVILEDFWLSIAKTKDTAF